jgi:hypothetical protein
LQHRIKKKAASKESGFFIGLVAASAIFTTRIFLGAATTFFFATFAFTFASHNYLLKVLCPI